MAQPPLDILLVEDNPGDARLMKAYLTEAGCTTFSLKHVESLGEAIHLVKDGIFGAVLLDLSLPDAEGLGGLIKLYAEAPDVPIVVMTGLSDEALAVEAVKQGAQDYLVKGRADGRAVLRAIRYAMERHRIQRELSEARYKLETINANLKRANMYKTEFLANVSHDLRSPLASTSEFIAVILDGLTGKITDEQREYLGIARDNIKHVARLIDDLFEASRLEARKGLLKYQTCNLANLLHQSVSQRSLKANGLGIHLTVEIENPDLDIYADSEKISEAVANLVENAMKFTPRGGKITLLARVFPSDPVLREILVSDTGPGMPPEDAERVFDRFYQAEAVPEISREASGLGLGLSIAREIVAAHQGKIWAESELGKGTTFHIVLPRFNYFITKTVEQAFLKYSPESCSLMVWQLSAPAGKEAASFEANIHETRRVIERCLRASDLVLPPIFRRAGAEIFLVAIIGTDKADVVERVLARIRSDSGQTRTVARHVLDLDALPCQVYPFPQGLCYPNEVLRKIWDITHMNEEE